MGITKRGLLAESWELGLNGSWVVQWDTFINNLKSIGIKLNSESDTLVQPEKKRNSIIIANMAYAYLRRKETNSEQKRWYKWMWKQNIPQNLKCFWWLSLKGEILTCTIC